MAAILRAVIKPRERKGVRRGRGMALPSFERLDERLLPSTLAPIGHHPAHGALVHATAAHSPHGAKSHPHGLHPTLPILGHHGRMSFILVHVMATPDSSSSTTSSQGSFPVFGDPPSTSVTATSSSNTAVLAVPTTELNKLLAAFTSATSQISAATTAVASSTSNPDFGSPTFLPGPTITGAIDSSFASPAFANAFASPNFSSGFNNPSFGFGQPFTNSNFLPVTINTGFVVGPEFTSASFQATGSASTALAFAVPAFGTNPWATSVLNGTFAPPFVASFNPANGAPINGFLFASVPSTTPAPTNAFI
jgi:hypothetical protein